MIRLNLRTLSVILLTQIFSPAVADVDFTTLALGSSSQAVQEILVTNKFMFSEFSEEQFTAKKIVIASNPNEGIKTGTEYPDIFPSTEIVGRFCSGKLYRLDATSYYMGQKNLFEGRKQIYSYIKANDGIFDKLNISQKKEDTNVGFSFVIDRSSGSGSVKGEEKIIVMMDASQPRFLQMRYRFENKWFCPE